MKPININITQAKISSIKVEFKPNDVPEVTTFLNLFTAQDKCISSFYVSNGKYTCEDNKIEISADLMHDIIQLSKHMESIVTLKCQASLKQLPEGIIKV